MTMERRRYEVDLQQQRAKVDEARKNAVALVTQVQKETPSEAQLQAAENAVKQIGVVLEAGAAFVKKDRDYALYAKECKAAASAASSSDLRKRRALYASAAEKLKACQDEGARMVKENASLAAVDVLVDGIPTRPQDVMPQCAQKAEALQAPLKRVDVELRFQEGQRKAYDAAKAHLSTGRKSEALAQLNDCIAEGRILENRYPDFKEQKFDIGGASMSMLALVLVCAKERKALQPSP
nr:hypothetical protein [Myxococcus xanthus]